MNRSTTLLLTCLLAGILGLGSAAVSDQEGAGALRADGGHWCC